MNDSKIKVLSAQTKALEYLQNEKEKVNKIIDELKQDYFLADEPLKRDIELKAEQTLEKLDEILKKLKAL